MVQRTNTMFTMDQYNRGANHFDAYNVDPFGSPTRFIPSLFKAILATAFFRCWHILLFFTAWATFVTIFNEQKLGGPNFQLSFANTLLTV